MNKKKYLNNKEKIIDFLIGFFGILAIGTIFSFISALILTGLPPQTTLTIVLSYFSGAIRIILYIGLMFCFLKRRKYIAIGILVSFIIYLIRGFLLGLMFSHPF
ncbi:hypothetical protein D4R42_00460 [bacterium]|nr:MAG: hypothetical protein D4R42_00460 [bacterium]